MAERNDSCEARIAEHQQGREEQFGPLLNPDDAEEADVISTYRERYTITDEEQRILDRYAEENDDVGPADPEDPDGETVFEAYERIVEEFREKLRDEGSEYLDESILAISTKVVLRIELSTGGPADYLTAELDSDGDVEDVTYHFADWFDHAERRVDSSSPLYSLATYYAEIAPRLTQE